MGKIVASHGDWTIALLVARPAMFTNTTDMRSVNRT